MLYFLNVRINILYIIKVVLNEISMFHFLNVQIKILYIRQVVLNEISVFHIWFGDITCGESRDV